jgi:hypothetical protein
MMPWKQAIAASSVVVHHEVVVLVDRSELTVEQLTHARWITSLALGAAGAQPGLERLDVGRHDASPAPLPACAARTWRAPCTSMSSINESPLGQGGFRGRAERAVARS